MNIVAIYVLSFGYVFHPLVSLLITKIILERKKRPDLFVYPVLSFLGGTLAAQPFSIGLAHQALSVFWPLFFLILFKGSKFKNGLLWIIILLLALTVSYEPAILFFILFALISVHNLLRAKKEQQSLGFDIFLIWYSLLSIAFLMYVLMGTAPPKSSQVFMQTLFEKPDAYRAFIFPAILAVFLYAFLFKIQPGILKIIGSIGLILFFLSLGFWFITVLLKIDYTQAAGYAIHPYIGNSGRATAVPLAFGLACIAYLDKVFSVNIFRRTSTEQKKLSIILSVLVVLASLGDLKITYHWNQGFQYMRQYVQTHVGCHNLSPEEYQKHLLASNIETYALHATAIVTQTLLGLDPIRLLVFTNAPHLGEFSERNACQFFNHNVFVNNQHRELFIHRTHLRYGPEIFDQVIKSQEH